MSQENSGRVPFNEIEGIASTNVPAYSNRKSRYHNCGPNFIYGIFTGYRWQCVEFARRWLLMRKSCIFRDVPCAFHIWSHVSYIERVIDGQRFPMRTFSNGSPEPPKKDSLLIYGPDQKMPFGHVAIITEVTPDYVHIAEQNNLYRYWPGDYARRARLFFQDDGYFIEDEDPVIGWMEIVDNNELQPFDEANIKNILPDYLDIFDNNDD